MLDVIAKIEAIVPQPINRAPTTKVLYQSSNTIDVYFDQPMAVANVTTPGFYHLIDATTGAITLPASIKYSVDSIMKLSLPTGTTSSMTTLSYNGVNATVPLGLSS